MKFGILFVALFSSTVFADTAICTMIGNGVKDEIQLLVPANEDKIEFSDRITGTDYGRFTFTYNDKGVKRLQLCTEDDRTPDSLPRCSFANYTYVSKTYEKIEITCRITSM